MKVDTNRLKKGTSEVPPECQQLIDRLRHCSRYELIDELKKIDSWTFGKCELYHWIDILDIFDCILEEATHIKDSNEWCLACDMIFGSQDVELLLLVLNFTTLLIEHSFSRHLYNSVEHLTRLLSSSNMDIVLGVLNLLYMFSKRSNFISRLNSAKKNSLLIRLNQIGESWGGKEYGFSLANCCKNTVLPKSASTFFFEYYNSEGTLETIEIPNLNSDEKHPSEIAKEICEQIKDLDDDQKVHIFARIRLSSSFSKYPERLLFVQARLQALSILVYSNSLQENIHTLLYPGFLEELVELLEMKSSHLVDIRAAALRTLTSIIHLDRNPHFPKKPGSRLGMIIEVTGAASYHGFLPTLVRNCIQHLTATTNLQYQQQNQQSSLSSSSSFSSSLTTMTTTNDLQQQKPCTSGISSVKNLPLEPQQPTNPFPLPLATALFSFLYHLSSYESGGEALVSCGMIESLLRVINWPGTELEHITFVTRAVRVIDLITNIEMQSFQNHAGLNSFIGRLDLEVNFCRREQPFEIEPQSDYCCGGNMGSLTSANNANGNNSRDDSIFVSDDTNMSTDDVHPSASSHSSSSYSSTAVKVSTPNLSSSLSFEQNSCNSTSSKTSKNIKTCLPQRAALLKSMLNFIKKVIQDSAFSDSIRHVMEGTLPSSLRHIISNAEYYGPSLFLLATDVVTVYVFQEPSLLSSLQDNGLTDVVLQALLKKDVPATREVLGSLPNVFSALCLNSRGLASFVKYEPFECLFKVLLSPVYLMAMRRRRSSDPMGDTASNLGNAMDELMRHQPSLKPRAIRGIIKLLEELIRLGTDPKYICWKATTTAKPYELPSPPRVRPSNGNISNDTGSSDEDEDDEEEASTSSHHNQREESSNQETTTGNQQENSERTPIPLIDYILNVMKFVDAILSNNSTDDHCREFVGRGGLKQLLSILALPNLPVDSPITASAQAVASVCKSILNLAHEPLVLQVALEQLAVIVDQLKPLQTRIESPGGSVLLRELANCPNINTAFSNPSYTPLLHGMSAVHGYVVMLVHICRTSQSEIRNLLLTKWGQDTRYGKKLLKNLVQLYTSLVWESTVLLALCTDDIFPYNCEFCKEDIEKLPSDPADDNITIMSDTIISVEKDNNTMDVEPESNDNDEATGSNDTEKKKVPKKLLPSPGQLKYIKALLGASSRLGRALAELFGNLVKLCVGSPLRQRRGQNFPPTPGYTRAESKYIARVLSYVLVDGFTYEKLPPTPIPKLKLTFLICSLGFTGPMLFDEKRFAFHLMLHKFVEEGGLEAFFETFSWALTAGHTIPLNVALRVQNFPDGTGEFLDAWLMLLEKMVNPKAILESPHVINTRGGRGKSEFDAALYLINIHRLAFEVVTQIWGMAPLPTYGVRMTESIMSIFKHILKGEKVIKEKMKKRFVETTEPTDKEPPAATTIIPLASLLARGLTSNGAGRTGGGGVAGGEGGGGSSSGGDGGGTRAMSPMIVNQSHLLRLMDMGFSREHCTEALMHTVSVEQATEYLLNHPPPPPPPPVVGGSANETESGETSSNQQQQSMDVDGDDEQINREQSKQGSAGPSLFSEKSSSSRRKSSKYQLTNDPPIPESIFVDFSTKAVDKCLRLMDQLPDTVTRGTELLVILYRKNDDAWGERMLDLISMELKDFLGDVMSQLKFPCDPNLKEKIYFSMLATKFQVRLRIFCLFLDETYSDIRIPAVHSLRKFNLIEELVKCLRTIEDVITTHGLGPTPTWLTQLIIFLDLYEKVAVYAQRKAEMHKVTTRIWKWYDVASGKWNAYSVSNNKIINDAYWSGETNIRISCGRQRYAINFNCMSQVNEETGNHRPVILALKATEGESSNEDTFISLLSDGSDAEDDDYVKRTSSRFTSAPRTETTGDTTTDNNGTGNSSSSSNTTHKKKSKSKSSKSEKENTSNRKFENEFKTQFPGLEEYYSYEIVSCLVRLMAPNVAVNRETLHAIMKLLVRLTKNFYHAELFVLAGGVRRLLSMKQTCGYIGFPTLSILLIRHALEEPKTLALAMERVIAARTMQTIPPGYRDLVFLLRQMSSAVSRDPKTFFDVAQSMLRIDVSVLRRNLVNEDNRLLLKSVITTKRPETMEEPVSIQVVHDLLNALIVPWCHPSSQKLSSSQQNCASDQKTCQQNNLSNQNSSNSSSTLTNTTITPTINAELNTGPFNHMLDITLINPGYREGNNQPALRHLFTRSMTANSPDSETTANTTKDHYCPWHIGPCVSHEHDKPLLPKATILKFLADAVRSYQTFAPLITEYVYKPEDSPYITENTTALSFIIDKLLPVTDQMVDREVSSMARVLISALASCSEQTSVQYTVVSEVKAAITRALALPESANKHSQLQMLAGLIPIMIDNCPLDNPALVKLHNLQPRRSDIFYIMVRKGLITDLAKLTQYLDLSSPYTIATVNAAMKPLETLLRMTNQPGPVPITKSKKTQSRRGNNTTNDDLQQTTRNPGSNIMNDFQLIDDEIQDQDLAVSAASEHHMSHSHSQSHSSRTRVSLNEIMEQILERVENDRSGDVDPREDNVDDFNPRTVVLETSSESADSESNGSDNDEREIDDEDENEEEGEDRSEIDVDEETRQFIEIYDHVYGRHLSPDLMVPAYGGLINNDQVENEAAANVLDRLNGAVGSSDRPGNSNAPGSPGRLMAVVNLPNIFEAMTNRPFLTSNTSTNPTSGSNSNAQSSSGAISAPATSIGDHNASESSIINVEVSGQSSTSGHSDHRIRININPGTGSSNTPTSLPSTATISNAHQHHHHHHVPHLSCSGSNNPPIIAVTASTSNQPQIAIPPSVSGSQISTGNDGSQSNNSSSIPQRLVFSRALRTHLGVPDTPPNVRQRRYQLLSLNSRNTPIILQRLLGPGNTAQANSSSNVQEPNELHGVNSANNNAFRDATRVILMDNAFGIFSNTDEGSIDLVDQTGYLFGRSLAATLSNTPTALHWWLEEAKALGLESQSDICLTVADSLIPQLEMQRNLELAKIRGKKKKKQPEDEKANDPEIAKILEEHKRTREENPPQMTPLEQVRNLALGVTNVENMPETQQQSTRQQQLSGNSTAQSQTTPQEADVSQTSQQNNQQQNSSRPRISIYNGADAEFEEADDALLNQEQRSTTNAANDVISTASSIDLFSDNEHSLPDTTLLQDDEGNEEDNDDEDEEDDDEEDDEDEDEIVNNSSDEPEETSEVGTEEDVYTLYYESQRMHEASMQQQRQDQTEQPQPQPSQQERQQEQQQQSEQQQTENNASQNEASEGAQLREGQETNIAGGRGAEANIAGGRGTEANITGGNDRQREGASLLSSPMTPARQSIADEEEMAAAVLMPLPIDDDDDEELDDILEILDNTTVSLTNNMPSNSPGIDANTSNMTSASVHSDDLDILNRTSSNIRSSRTATNNANVTMMPTMNENDDEELDDILDILDHTTSISNNTATANTNSITSVSDIQIVSSSTAVEGSTMIAEERGSCGGSSNNGTIEISAPEMTDESLTNRQNRTNETQEEEGAVGGILSSLTANSNTRTGQQQITDAVDAGEQQNQQESVETQPQQQQQQQQGTDTDSARNLLGDLEVPEGVDPSFLAALPYEMREEVIAEHLRLQRIRQRAQQNAIQVEQASVIEVNPEFLAALPPNIQEEVLAQQRIEQQRQAAAAANPNDPVDAAAFFQNLQPALRQAILTDMEDSQISVLPPELAAEAQNLRRDWENRNRQMMEERLLNQIGSATPSLPSVRYLYRRPRFPHVMRPRWTNWNVNANSAEASNSPSLMTLMERQGRPLLDHEALTSLLTLLFIDEPKFNTLRLHRVVRNLCCHVPTREWIIKALLSIIERCNSTSNELATCSSLSPTSSTSSSLVSVRPKWLNIRLNAALGCRANVFVIKKDVSEQSRRDAMGPSSSAGPSTPTFCANDYVVSIHPQASQIVCKHTLDLLITLAKGFPKNFLPYKKQPITANVTNISSSSNVTASTSSQQATVTATMPTGTTTTTTTTTATTTTTTTATTEALIPSTSASTSTSTLTSTSTSMNTGNTPSETEKTKKSLNTNSSSSIGTSASFLDNDGCGNLNGNNESSADFWEIIIKLDCTAKQPKLQNPPGVGNASNTATGSNARQSSANIPSNQINNDNNSSSNCSTSNNKDIVTFDESPFGQLISMLSYDIIRKSTQLTDKLLRLLSFISVGLPDEKSQTNIKSTATTSDPGGSSGLGGSSGPGGPSGLGSSGPGGPSGLGCPSGPGGPSTSSSSAVTGASNDSSTKINIDEEMSDDEPLLPNSENQLRLAIEVLTSKSCSEEGLEDATSLLLNMSQCSNQTRTIILNLLIRGAKDLARMVQQQIKDLMHELKELNHKSDVNNSLTTPSSGEISPEDSALLTNTSNTSSTVPNVNLLGSSSVGVASSSTVGGSKSKGMLQDRFTKETVVITAPTKVKQICELQLSSMVPLISKTSSQRFFLRVLKVIIQIREAVREANGKIENRGRIVLGPNELTPLSETLDLDDLWDTLSECLYELEDTADNHAVLVLQPAVEAFFLVHASTVHKMTSSSSTPASSARPHRNRLLPHFDLFLPEPPMPDLDYLQTITTGAMNSSRYNLSNISSAVSSLGATITTTTSTTSNAAPTEMTTSSSSSMAASNTDYSRLIQQDDDDDSLSVGDSSTNQASGQSTISSSTKKENLDQKKFLQFAEKHRTVLNQILRQTTTHLADGPFAVLVDHTRILDFDVKRRYFRTELERLDEGIRREELAVHVHRVTVFEDSFRELYRRNPEEWKNRFYIVFEDEEGQDAGGLLREWYVIISREIFNPMYALFTVSPGDRVTYMINPSSHANPNHLCYYKFVGRVIAKAIYDNKLLECYFTRSFYKHILGIQVKYTDMESEDYDFYKGLVFLLENHISELGYELTFSLEVQEFGVTEVRDLISNGRNIPVTEDNKLEYIRLVCQLKMSGSIRQQLNAFLEGFYDIIPKRLISIFNEQELELLISGLPNVDIEDLKANTEYHKYQANSIQIQWFWRALRSFDQADRAKFLQFVTGTSKVPLQGFAALEGMNGTQKFQIHRDDRSTDRLPSAHTCFNQLDLPVYKTYDKLRSSLLKAIHECSEGFGFA